MYKNQLQELAQRSCFNLPAYSCIREGPDHAPRFKATVNFNGEIFESPHFCTTLRQAEHAAAEVALNTLSKRGPSQSLAAKILDETSVCKNLLQETAQRVGVSLPVYTTMKLGPGHLPVFKCLVEVAGRVFAGEPAKTKKQAEKNAAMAAWSVIKQWTQPPAITSSEDAASNDGMVVAPGAGSNAVSPRIMGGYQRSPSWFDNDPTQQDSFSKSLANGGNGGGRILPLPWHHQPRQQRLSRLSLQSHSDRFELRRPLMEELELLQKEGDDDWLSGGLGGVESMTPRSQQHQQQPQTAASPSGSGHSGLPRRAMYQSQSERFELKPSLLDELYHNDEEEWWLRGELMQPVAMLERARSALRGEQENGSVVFYDGNRGSLYGGNESVSHGSSDFGNIGNAFTTGFRDVNNIPTGGFHEVAAQEVSYGPYADGNKFQASFAGFQNASSSKIPYEDMERRSVYSDFPGDKGSSHADTNYDRDGGSSSYANFPAVDVPGRYYYNNEGVKTTLGYSNSARSMRLAENEVATSSAAAWCRSAQLWGTQASGLRQANSVAPPVRVRQMVAVCSAPPPRCPALDPATTSNSSSLYLQEQNPPSSSAEASACHLFSQLRI
ncbi:hypothetical protein GOP47_0000294 [Adiantum capillus-veneris]|uniref:DRBM domain-containing protein n=1 Tax=Adiantum capillus-veneris TaxID=13818 RepID=A0A9D4VDN7_ADICA|nr:hypothetical protein GOP47_0000294 [Adiantum capillus-veneris]